MMRLKNSAHVLHGLAAAVAALLVLNGGSGVLRAAAAPAVLPSPVGKAPADAKDAAAAAPVARDVTYSKDIAPILFEHCAACHRPGEVAPFTLLDYKDAKRRAGQIADVVDTRIMPPWLPAAGHGQFKGERRLSDAQVAAIRAWADNGAPEGNPADLPPAPKFTEGWSLGEPDLVVKMPQKYTLRAEGRDVFRVFVIPLNLKDDQFVTAVDFRPSNRKIVHHALFFLDNTGAARKLDAEDSEPGYARMGGVGFLPTGGLGGWAPGITAHPLPDGVGRPLPKGSDLVIQMHFHPSGKPEDEQSQIGLYFTKRPPEKIAASFPKSAKRSSLDIPPGEKNYVVQDTFTLPLPATLIGITPHAHLLCKEIRVDATLPDGQKQTLIWIPQWNWGWQDQFMYKEPLVAPAGTKIDLKYVFDNSSDNPANPNSPPKRVTWGEQTADEMAITFFHVIADANHPLAKLGRGSGAAAQPGGADKNNAPGSGVAGNEFVQQLLLRRFDKNKNGKIDGDEQEAVRESLKQQFGN